MVPFFGYYNRSHFLYAVMRERKMQEKMRTLDNQNRILEDKYAQFSDFYCNNAKLYHDMKHHLNAMDYMLD